MKLVLSTKVTSAMILGALLFIIALPEVTSAQPLVPCSGSSCGTCEMVQLADNVVDFIILISVSIAALVFMWAGYLMLSAGGNAGQIKRGRDVLTDAIIGLVIVLACWLIVDLMLKSLLQNNGEVYFPNGVSATCNPSSPNFPACASTGGGWLPWNQIQCSSQNTMSDTPSRFPGDSNWQNVPGAPQPGAASNSQTGQNSGFQGVIGGSSGGSGSTLPQTGSNSNSQTGQNSGFQGVIGGSSSSGGTPPPVDPNQTGPQ